MVSCTFESLRDSVSYLDALGKGVSLKRIFFVSQLKYISTCRNALAIQDISKELFRTGRPTESEGFARITRSSEIGGFGWLASY